MFETFKWKWTRCFQSLCPKSCIILLHFVNRPSTFSMWKSITFRMEHCYCIGSMHLQHQSLSFSLSFGFLLWCERAFYCSWNAWALKRQYICIIYFNSATDMRYCCHFQAFRITIMICILVFIMLSTTVLHSSHWIFVCECMVRLCMIYF